MHAHISNNLLTNNLQWLYIYNTVYSPSSDLCHQIDMKLTGYWQTFTVKRSSIAFQFRCEAHALIAMNKYCCSDS